MLIGLETQQFDQVSAEEFGLGNLTIADGLAVPRTSALVAKLMNHDFSGGYTLKDESFKALLTNLYQQENIFLEPAAVAGSNLYQQENIFLEPAAVAGLADPFKLLNTKAGLAYLQ